MKNTSEKLEEPLTDLNEIFHDRAKEMFRSLLKVGLVKRSRYTPKQHAVKIISNLLDLFNST